MAAKNSSFKRPGEISHNDTIRLLSFQEPAALAADLVRLASAVYDNQRRGSIEDAGRSARLHKKLLLKARPRWYVTPDFVLSDLLREASKSPAEQRALLLGEFEKNLRRWSMNNDCGLHKVKSIKNVVESAIKGTTDIGDNWYIKLHGAKIRQDKPETAPTGIFSL